MTAPSYDRAFFDALYAANPDPWDFRTSPYEQQKYAASFAALGDRRYAAALEVGCSIGELSAQLAQLCDRYLGVDIAEQPLETARERCAALPHVRFERRQLPAEWPDGSFDLIVLSEVLYFLSDAEIARVAALARTSLMPRGRVLLVNWLGAPATPQPGDQAAEIFIATSVLRPLTTTQEKLYRLDLLEKPDV